MSKSRPILFNDAMVRAILAGTKTQTRRPIRQHRHADAKCPMGEVGDTLWVRECFAELEPSSFAYRADHDDWGEDCPRWWNWSPSIHMPRRASRLTLRVTGVRIERVQDITYEDAHAEDVIPEQQCACDGPCALYRAAFASLWNDVYGTWDANPWVWAITFEVVR